MSDRGMKKWAPYKSLNEQWDTLDALHEREERVERPTISNEVAEEINEKLVNYKKIKKTVLRKEEFEKNTSRMIMRY